MSTFVIISEGRVFAPVTIRSDDLLVGSAVECGLRLNHPSVPLALAGIKQVGTLFYFLPLKTSPFTDAKPTTVLFNGHELTGDIALADNDTITVGGFQLVMRSEGEALVIRVGVSEHTQTVATVAKSPTPDRARSEAAVDVLGKWIRRRLWKGRRKLPGTNLLQPTAASRQPGTEFNWSPTNDLVRPWPVRFLFMSVLTLFGAALLTFFFWPSVFAPGTISRAHSRSTSILSPPIASTPNAGSCLNCHRPKSAVEQNCAKCHSSLGFQANISDAHQAAGLTCISCHTEHKGSEFSPKAAAFDSCAKCHNDENKQRYNGKSVHLPHGGTFGYPVVSGKWVWPGLSLEALKLKPEVVVTLEATDDAETSSRVQFHAIHLYRIKVTGGLTGIKDGSLSCSSCHKSFQNKFDRATPRQTCGVCHNGYVAELTNQRVVDENKPNCTSCHVEHLYDAYRWGDLLTEPAHEKRQRAIDKNYIDAVRRSAKP